MDTSDYEDKMNQLLDDRQTYEEVFKPPFKKKLNVNQTHNYLNWKTNKN